MINEAAIGGLIFQLSFVLLIVIGLIIFLKVKKQLVWKPFFTGILIFVLFSQVLEKALHFLVISPSGTELKWTSSIAAFVIYGALAAGVFEELGRYFGFKVIIKKAREYRDGLSFGLGHGGIEALLLGVLGAVNLLIIAMAIKNGTFESEMGKLLGDDQKKMLMHVLSNDFGYFVLAALERIPAILIHMAFSLLVLYGIRTDKFKYVLYAIGLHALIDVVPALYQTGVIKSLYVIEAYIAAIGVICFVFIRKARAYFNEQ